MIILDVLSFVLLILERKTFLSRDRGCPQIKIDEQAVLELPHGTITTRVAAPKA